MTYSKPTSTTTRRILRLLLVGLLIVIVASTVALGERLLASSSTTVAAPIQVPGGEQPRPPQAPRQAVGDAVPPTNIPGDEHLPPQAPRQAVGDAVPPTNIPGDEQLPQPAPRRTAGDAVPLIDIPRSEHRSALGEADGVVPDGTTVFDDEIPGVANLHPALLAALRQAATDAADDGIKLFVTSGWRSPEYQNQLLREAVSIYGSAKEAARWVATADTSPHVSGGAADIGPFDATAWLSEHGAKYGLCQIYRNEPWHYELRPEAIDQGCPRMYADPTHDPRMQQ